MQRELFHHLLFPTKKLQIRDANWDTYCDPCKRKWEQYYRDLGWVEADSDDEPVLQYLTPELIQIFRNSEIFRMEKKRTRMQQPIVEAEVLEIEEDYKTVALKARLENQFKEGEKRKPVVWPVLPMSF
ncbi:hypothetical protein HDV06_006870 [Boothiomyces sp. JEL0866]|nr:hypothetical protein HDV06_006870 [Boothiomyces sp. JEL0866]